MNIENLLKCLRSYLANIDKPVSETNKNYGGLCLYYATMDGDFRSQVYDEIQELRHAMADAFICGPWRDRYAPFLDTRGRTTGRIAFVEAAIKFLESKQ